jgi:hypothetical protein
MVVPAPFVRVKDHDVVVPVDPDAWYGILVGTGRGPVDADQVVVEEGQPPLPTGETCSDPGVLELVAQFT